MISGVINVYKEKGFTSFDVVAKMRGIAGQKKIGHTGTLDPEAEGVLPVCLGSATRACEMLTDTTKAYRAVLLLGIRTDTQDMTGKILEKKPVCAEESEVREALFSFLGDSMQIPPMYSALKQNGKKLYELARKGIEVERAPRPITIYDLQIEKMDLPEVTFTVSCSKGTYIRSLCQDIGDKLGCGGTMKGLTRIRVGSFLEENSLRLGELQKLKEEGRLMEAVLNTDELFPDYEKVQVLPAAEKRLQNGNWLDPDAFRVPAREGKIIRVYDGSDRFMALYCFEKERNCWKPLKMFPAD